MRLLRVRAVASVILYCKLPDCGQGYASTGDLPVRCPACGRITKWSTAPAKDHQEAAIMWTAEDRRFLRSFRISAE